MNLTGYALSALNAAQAGLATSSHNLDNAATPGYSRQSIIVAAAPAQNSGGGYIGQGVIVQSVQRSVNDFINQQLNSAQTRASALDTFGNEVSQINNLFADRTVGLFPALQGFFSGLQGVATSPADPAAREQALGNATQLVGQFNSVGDYFDEQRGDINNQIQTTVSQINSAVGRISALNGQITAANAVAGGQPPNDLLDARDTEVANLQKLVNVNVSNQNGQFALTLGDGHVLLSGGTQYNLVAAPSQSDSASMTVYASVPGGAGGATMLDPVRETLVSGGSLGGLFAYRTQSLDPLEKQLGLLATGLALAVNAQQAQGLDANGATGTPMFSITPPAVASGAKNTGSATVSAAFDASNLSALRASDYTLSYDGTNYTLVRASDGATLYTGASVSGLAVDGVTMSVGGGAHAGDTWTISPVTRGAQNIAMTMTSPAQIAAADTTGGSANGNNALALAGLQNEKLLGGKQSSFSDAYASLVDQVGNQTQENANNLTAQQALVTQNYNAQQAVSGVNVNEEYVNIQQYQSQYQAAAKLVQVSETLFQTILGAVS
ncbi:MAG: flagellar hook-associated protein FlgK [Candidimonas sp.]|nr:MAG: flagellar hook-associated protein FlgK [Candidimonas sp.]